MGKSNPFHLTSDCYSFPFWGSALCSSYFPVLLGAPPRCAGFTSTASSTTKTNYLRNKKWKEGVTVRDGAHSLTIKQPTLSSYCQNPQACALCGPGQPMDKQSSTQAPIIIFVSIQSFQNRIRDWSYYGNYVIIDFNISCHVSCVQVRRVNNDVTSAGCQFLHIINCFLSHYSC